MNYTLARIKEAAKFCKVPLEDICSECDILPATFRAYETGRIRIHFDSVVKIAKFLNHPIDFFIDPAEQLPTNENNLLTKLAPSTLIPIKFTITRTGQSTKYFCADNRMIEGSPKDYIAYAIPHDLPFNVRAGSLLLCKQLREVDLYPGAYVLRPGRKPVIYRYSEQGLYNENFRFMGRIEKEKSFKLITHICNNVSRGGEYANFIGENS